MRAMERAASPRTSAVARPVAVGGQAAAALAAAAVAARATVVAAAAARAMVVAVAVARAAMVAAAAHRAVAQTAVTALVVLAAGTCHKWPGIPVGFACCVGSGSSRRII